MTQGEKMRSIALDPLSLHERKYATDIERIVTDLHLCPHHITIVEFLRPVKLIMNLDPLSIRYLYLFSSFRRWQRLHEKLQIILNVAIGAHPTQRYSGIVLLAWCPFECRMVFIIVDIVAPLAEPPVKGGQGPDCLAAWINRWRHFSRVFQGFRVSQDVIDKSCLRGPEEPFFDRSRPGVSSWTLQLRDVVIGQQCFKIDGVEIS